MKNFNYYIGRIACSNFLYNLFIKQFHKEEIFNYFNFKIDLKGQPNAIKSALFFHIHERSEVALINRYLIKNYPVIELGASIGATGLIINNIVQGQKVLSVEANPFLIPNLKRTKSLNKLSNWHIINAAIDYSNLEEVTFSIDPYNLGSHKIDAQVSTIQTTRKSVSVLPKTITEIYNEYLNNEEFVLIADIEGAEVEFILNEEYIFRKCKQLIIELHDTSYNGNQYSKRDIAYLIKKNWHMKIEYEDGKTWVFKSLF